MQLFRSHPATKLEIARGLIGVLDTETIRQITGLTLEEIQQLNPNS